MRLTDHIIQRAAKEISIRNGCIVHEIEPIDEPCGVVVSCKFESGYLERNYLTLVHSIDFSNKVVKGFVSVDDLDFML